MSSRVVKDKSRGATFLLSHLISLFLAIIILVGSVGVAWFPVKIKSKNKARVAISRPQIGYANARLAERGICES